MDDKGEVKCIKFSLENKILAVQRTSKTVVSTALQKGHGMHLQGSEWPGAQRPGKHVCYWFFGCLGRWNCVLSHLSFQ